MIYLVRLTTAVIAAAILRLCAPAPIQPPPTVPPGAVLATPTPTPGPKE
jgi:hypothetical protein